MDNAVHVENLLRAINRVEDPPVADRILGQTGQILGNRLVAEISDVGRQPFRLIEHPLRQFLVQRGKIGDDGGFAGKAIPGNGRLPFQPEFFSDLITADAFRRDQRLFQACPERLTELQAQIRIPHQFAKPVIHQTAHQLFELLRRELRKVHALS